LVELHQHRHQLRRVRHDLAADAVAQVGPGRVGGVEEGVHAVGLSGRTWEAPVRHVRFGEL
jgi:hypothetical protein